MSDVYKYINIAVERNKLVAHLLSKFVDIISEELCY